MPVSEGAIVTEDFWTFETDGTFSKKGDKVKFNIQSITMPRFKKEGKDVQVYLSEMSINSGIEAANQLNLLATPLFSVSKDYVRQWISGIDEAFEGDDTYKVQFVSSFKRAPQVYLKQNGSRFSGLVDLQIKNPHN
jgi:hypothetical protein